ncbi:unnamed protein product [Larinioides sclopetarius]|uniref:Uncharacterized protein n=1 Tax=Larinioides sclopetarius TaxID=280406 RepID=A0AAV2BB98_9ARAC
MDDDSYIYLPRTMADEISGKKQTSKMDREVQTDKDWMKEHQLTQTEDLPTSAIDSEENEISEIPSDVSDQKLLAEIITTRDELSSGEEGSSSETENDSDSSARPVSKIPFSFKKRLAAVNSVCDQVKFLAQNDPNFFKTVSSPVNKDKMTDARLQKKRNCHSYNENCGMSKHASRIPKVTVWIWIDTLVFMASHIFIVGRTCAQSGLGTGVLENQYPICCLYCHEHVNFLPGGVTFLRVLQGCAWEYINNGSLTLESNYHLIICRQFWRLWR